MYKIEKDVPMPRGAKPVAQYSIRYAFDGCDVGSSFLVPFSDMKEQALRAAYGRWRSGANKLKTFTIRRVEGGFRCWRTE